MGDALGVALEVTLDIDSVSWEDVLAEDEMLGSDDAGLDTVALDAAEEVLAVELAGTKLESLAETSLELVSEA